MTVSPGDPGYKYKSAGVPVNIVAGSSGALGTSIDALTAAVNSLKASVDLLKTAVDANTAKL